MEANNHPATDKANVLKQYANEENLKKRYRFHQKYGTNQVSLDEWLFQNYTFGDGYEVLELGCGDGRIWEACIDRLSAKISLTLSDFSKGMLEKVRKKYGHLPNVTFRRIDIEDIPYGEGSFDCVIANSMLYHVPNLRKAIGEVHRILKPRGVFYAATYGENGLNDFVSQTLSEWNKEYKLEGNKRFTLQNGGERLAEFFRHVEVRARKNDLVVTHIPDLVDYILTMPAMMGVELDGDELLSFLDGKRDENGALTIPNPFGTFLAMK